jgi:hypothetical protein
MRRLFVVALLVLGCDEVEPNPVSLDGEWRLEMSGGCESKLALDVAGGTYAHHTLCPAGGGTANDETEEGALQVLDGRHLSLEPHKTSCGVHTPISGVITYRAAEEHLTLYFPAQSETYSRAASTLPPHDTVRYGCYELTGFMPYTFQTL